MVPLPLLSVAFFMYLHSWWRLKKYNNYHIYYDSVACFGLTKSYSFKPAFLAITNVIMWHVLRHIFCMIKCWFPDTETNGSILRCISMLCP